MIFSRPFVLMLVFLLATGIIAFTWSLSVPDIADDWTICLGKYPRNTQQGPVSEGTVIRPAFFKHNWTARFDAHPFGLFEGMDRLPAADPVLCVLPRTISMQTNFERFTTTSSGLCALTVLFGTAALLAWFVDHEVQRRVQVKCPAPLSSELPGYKRKNAMQRPSLPPSTNKDFPSL